ncbi:MAG: hypothetical protein UV02_C0003G0009 [Candidatus Kuenenbacteria bacterium GW2011_GWA2_42_15]|uniref:Uncharacterized protein n=1 Tax=Candidatus Kuenenbacteria bacterium GW2011_GWA2_42_15 TaxID=1618677 RepID=A0A0G0Z3F7_9BACT|nr:MAG: hypothetical protein UV02_C0003G0009 [Candidatus Kuenenbacteria bacterium GW2011_GWA2_42_15]
MPTFFPREPGVCAKRDLADFTTRRGGSIAAKINFIHAKNISRTEERADIKKTADVLGDEIDFFFDHNDWIREIIMVEL